MKILNILTAPITTTILILALSGCSGEKEHDINYYLEHPEERKVKLEACHGDVRKRDLTARMPRKHFRELY